MTTPHWAGGQSCNMQMCHMKGYAKRHLLGLVTGNSGRLTAMLPSMSKPSSVMPLHVTVKLAKENGSGLSLNSYFQPQNWRAASGAEEASELR